MARRIAGVGRVTVSLRKVNDGVVQRFIWHRAHFILRMRVNLQPAKFAAPSAESRCRNSTTRCAHRQIPFFPSAPQSFGRRKLRDRTRQIGIRLAVAGNRAADPRQNVPEVKAKNSRQRAMPGSVNSRMPTSPPGFSTRANSRKPALVVREIAKAESGGDADRSSHPRTASSTRLPPRTLPTRERLRAFSRARDRASPERNRCRRPAAALRLIRRESAKRARGPAQKQGRPCRSRRPARALRAAAECAENASPCAGARRGRAKTRADGSENRSAARSRRTSAAHAPRLRARRGFPAAAFRKLFGAVAVMVTVFYIPASWAIAGVSANARATTGHGTSMPHSVLPMRRGRTHSTRPPRAFLSPARIGRNSAARIFPSVGSGPILATRRMMRTASCVAQVIHGHRQQRRRNHSPPDRFAMQKAPVAGGRFERMADGMPEIQNLPQAAFAFVLVHHVRLDRRASGNDAPERSRIAPKHRRHALLKKSEQIRDRRSRRISPLHRARNGIRGAATSAARSDRR